MDNILSKSKEKTKQGTTNTNDNKDSNNNCFGSMTYFRKLCIPQNWCTMIKITTKMMLNQMHFQCFVLMVVVHEF